MVECGRPALELSRYRGEAHDAFRESRINACWSAGAAVCVPSNS